MRAIAFLVAAWLATACAAPQPAAPTVAPPATGAAAPATRAAEKPLATPAAKAPEQPQPSPEVRRLLAAARDRGETELNLSWADDNIGGSEGARRFESLFNRTYGTSIKVNFTPGVSFNQAVAKLAQEVAAGQTAHTDLMPGTGGNFGNLIELGALEEYDYTQLSPRITRELVAPKNVGVEILSRTPSIVYNTNLVAANDAPRKLVDVLDPKWKGKFATPPGANSFDSVAQRPEWGADRMKTFFVSFAQQAGGLIRAGELDRIASGEYSMLVMGSGSHEVRAFKAKGAPLADVIPDDGALASFNYLGVPRTSAHPNLAKLYASLVISEDGQKIVYETQLTDHHALAGSQSAAQLNDLRARAVKPLKVDAKFFVDNPGAEQLRLELVKILQDTRGG